MNEINITEMKARFFALYYGQDVVALNGLKDITVTIDKYFRAGHFEYDDCLSLRSIESLTDDEYLHIWELLFSKMTLTLSSTKDIVDSWLKLLNKETGGYLPKNYVTLIDYLRSIGILIPFMGLSTDDILEYGWAKIQEAKG